jgi:hypothetical protein
MKLKLFALSAALLTALQSLTAQVSIYTFSQFPGTYSAVANPTMVGSLGQDDDVTPLTLPFTFTFNGTAYTSINVCSNGYLSFGALTGTEYGALSDATTTNVIAPFADDLFMINWVIGDLTVGSNSITNCSSVIGFSIGDVIADWNNDFGGNPTITNIVGSTIVVNLTSVNTMSGYDVLNMNSMINESVSGTSPNRVYEIEYQKMARFFVTDETISYKVRLYETTNRVEFVYGTCIAGAGFTSPEVGLKGATNLDYSSRNVTDGVNTWSNSIASTNISDLCDFTAGTFPLVGQVYQWSPPTCTVPVLAITPNSSITCEGQVLTLTGSGATTYTWDAGDTTPQFTVIPTASATYTLIGANQVCTTAIVYTANVAANPTVTITQPRPTICAGQSSTLLANGATTYSWNGVAGTATNIISPAATSTIVLSGSDGTCVASESIVQTVSACTGISEAAIASGKMYEAFPNPFTNNITINNTSAVSFVASISDALGKMVLSSEINSGETVTINTEQLAKGVYIVSVKGSQINEAKRFVKQ